MSANPISWSWQPLKRIFMGILTVCHILMQVLWVKGMTCYAITSNAGRMSVTLRLLTACIIYVGLMY